MTHPGDPSSDQSNLPQGTEFAARTLAEDEFHLVPCFQAGPSATSGRPGSPGKLIVPALEALKDTGALLIVATGYSKTEELRESYPQDNIIIEDFVDFDYVLDHTDLFICNGGYGSILLSLSKGVPVLAAGIREGKNDINAHVDYFGVGIDLRTESPRPADIQRGAERILREPQWKQNAARLRDELGRYDPNELIDAYLTGGPTRALGGNYEFI